MAAPSQAIRLELGLLLGLCLIAAASGLSIGFRRGNLRHSTQGGSRITSSAAMETVLFIELGFGNDQHGQNPTKAAVRACRNAIEFNSIPSIAKIVPGGYEGMRLRLQLAVPTEYHGAIDLAQVQAVFPYGHLDPIELVAGGMKASSGIALEAMGDRDDSMIIVIAHVSVGY
jgi:uncharacterized protein (TIGR02058 family)